MKTKQPTDPCPGCGSERYTPSCTCSKEERTWWAEFEAEEHEAEERTPYAGEGY